MTSSLGAQRQTDRRRDVARWRDIARPEFFVVLLDLEADALPAKALRAQAPRHAQARALR